MASMPSISPAPGMQFKAALPTPPEPPKPAGPGNLQAAPAQPPKPGVKLQAAPVEQLSLRGFGKRLSLTATAKGMAILPSPQTADFFSTPAALKHADRNSQRRFITRESGKPGGNLLSHSRRVVL